jgi:aspartyl-tRNA(Asn)/glutamyl-tRNA(Gln) amidotransferase subunit B
MEKGVMRIEPNISIRPAGSKTFGTRVEIKNLNSFRALERAVDYEIKRQIEMVEEGKPVVQQTLGWDESRGVTVTQRIKEGEDDYRYFPEPDLPPLVIEKDWIETIRAGLPELPAEKLHRFQTHYGLSEYDAGVLIAERAVAQYFEETLAALPAGSPASPKLAANWITGELFGLLNQAGAPISASRVTPAALASLLDMIARNEINQNTAKTVLAEVFTTGKTPQSIVAERGLKQVSDPGAIGELVQQVISENTGQVEEYLAGKETISRWLFGQVMRAAKGKANPQVVEQELNRRLSALKHSA